MKTSPVFNGTATEAGRAAILENRFGHACQTLVAIVEGLKGYRNVGSTAPGVSDPKLDGGAEPAFEAAIQAVLGRIEKMAGDDTLWSLPPEVLQIDLAEARLRLRGIKLAVHGGEEKDRPCHKYNVEVSPIDTGGFCCFMRLSGGSIVGGFGDSVDAAMRAFDREWVKKKSEYTPLPETPPPAIYGATPGEDDEPEDPKPQKPGNGSAPEPPPEPQNA